MSDIRKFFAVQPKQPGKSAAPPNKPPQAKPTVTKTPRKPTSARKKRVIESDDDNDEKGVEEEAEDGDHANQPSPYFADGKSSTHKRRSPARSAEKRCVNALKDEDTEEDEPEKHVAPSRNARKTAKIPDEVKEPVDPTAFFGTNKVTQTRETMVAKTPVQSRIQKAKSPPKSTPKAAAPPKKSEEIDDDDPFEDLPIDVEMLDASKYLPETKLAAGKENELESVPVAHNPNFIEPPSKRARTESGSTRAQAVNDDDEKRPRKTTSTAVKTPAKNPASSTPAKKTPAKSEGKDEDDFQENANDKEQKKNSGFAAYQRRSGPSALGSKEIPEGADNCLTGLSFCFSGELSSISREDAGDLVKRYGARVVTAPSGKTDYVVLGDSPGESKLKKIKDLKIKTLDEDGLFDLVRTRPAKPDQDVVQTKGKGKGKGKSKMTAAEASIVEITEPMPCLSGDASATGSIDQLWTDKYRPQKYTELVGNKKNVETLAAWLKSWDAARANKFKATFKDKNQAFRAALLSGPPGIGKTTAAHLVCALEGFNALEFNASDARSKKTLDQNIMELIGNQTITEFYNASETPRHAAKSQVIIMDEVDGMSAGDRGGMAELVALIKKTQVPIICICNDRSSPKVRTLANYCLDLRFRRPDAAQCRSRLMSIAYRENLNVKANAVDQLVQATQSDIRQVLNLLSSYRLSADTMDYDQSKDLSKSSQKNVVLNPFQMYENLMFGQQHDSKNFAERLNIYFDDFNIAPLMVQENYIRMIPSNVDRTLPPKLAEIQHMDCLANAADSISDGDMMDALIHGQGHWGLMPAHSAFSCVRPAYFMHGGITRPEGGGMAIGFPSWLGQNSRSGKGNRLLRELQLHLRLRISGDRSEVRQSYLPALIPKLTQPLIHLGNDGVDPVIEVMDHYYISREDWESLLELGLGACSGEAILKDIPTAVKSSFTRKYNKATHPVVVPTVLTTAGKKRGRGGTGGGAIPDFEDAVEVEDEENGNEEEEEDEIAASALVRPKATAKTSGKGKAAASKASSSKTAAKASSSGSRGGRKK